MAITTTDMQTKRIEYRVERMPSADEADRPYADLLDRLNELGRQGWHVVSVDLTHHAWSTVGAPSTQALPVLLEREVIS